MRQSNDRKNLETGGFYYACLSPNRMARNQVSSSWGLLFRARIRSGLETQALVGD